MPLSPLRADVAVSSVTTVGKTTHAVTRMLITDGEPVFAGHYPGFPILPGVCVVECVHRSALSVASAAGRQIELEAVRSARFRDAVRPGDELIVELTLIEEDTGWRCDSVVRTGRGNAATVRLRYQAGEAT